jgi:hypothetical protein
MQRKPTRAATPPTPPEPTPINRFATIARIVAKKREELSRAGAVDRWERQAERRMAVAPTRKSAEVYITIIGSG